MTYCYSVRQSTGSVNRYIEYSPTYGIVVCRRQLVLYYSTQSFKGQKEIFAETLKMFSLQLWMLYGFLLITILQVGPIKPTEFSSALFPGEELVTVFSLWAGGRVTYNAGNTARSSGVVEGNFLGWMTPPPPLTFAEFKP